MAKPILFIHGAFSTGAVWDKMKPLFKAKGYAAITPTLFPEYRTRTGPNLDLSALTLHDYVEATVKTVRQIQKEYGEEPVIIGHSMGSLVAQKLAERNIGAAAVFITPSAPIDCAIQNPKTLFKLLNIVIANNAHKSYKPWDFGASWGIFNRLAKDEHKKCIDDFVFESGQVLHNLAYPDKDSHRIAIIDETRIGIKTLTIGALHDRTCIIESVRKTGQKYARVGGDYKEYSDAGHVITIEPTHIQLAEDIMAWIDAKQLSP